MMMMMHDGNTSRTLVRKISFNAMSDGSVDDDYASTRNDR
jgi:hypothetical protein